MTLTNTDTIGRMKLGEKVNENKMGLYRKLEKSIKCDVMRISCAGMIQAIENGVGGKRNDLKEARVHRMTDLRIYFKISTNSLIYKKSDANKVLTYSKVNVLNFIFKILIKTIDDSPKALKAPRVKE